MENSNFITHIADWNLESFFDLRRILIGILGFFLLSYAILFTQLELAHAVNLPRTVGGEARVKVINYVPNQVIRFTAHYNYHSIIQFASDETIETITMGTPNAWQLHPQGNLLYVKPIDSDATTNMTLITNKRMYLFEMHAEFADGISDPSLSFVTKFLYSDANNGVNLTLPGGGAVAASSDGTMPDLSKPENYNFNYKISGKSKDIEPLLVFDDGEFTYLKFSGKNTELPAIFMVDAKNQEGLVNYRLAHGYVIIERVHDRFTLRHGREVVCLFNENYRKI